MALSSESSTLKEHPFLSGSLGTPSPLHSVGILKAK